MRKVASSRKEAAIARTNEVFDSEYKLLYESYLESIERALNSGERGVQWVKPWANSDINTYPINISTGQFYSGINDQVLGNKIQQISHKNLEYDNRFVGFKQGSDLGLRMKKGAKAHHVLRYQTTYMKEQTNANGEKEKVALPLKTPRRLYLNVFHMSDFENAPPMPEIENNSPFNNNEMLDQFLEKACSEMGVNTFYANGNKCNYMESTHSIQLVDPRLFTSAESFYGVYFHELVHASAHESQLKRQIGNSDIEYAKEEIVAELGAYMLARKLFTNVEPKNTANYIKSYLDTLPASNRETIFIECASKANSAANHIVEKSGMAPIIEGHKADLSAQITRHFEENKPQPQSKVPDAQVSEPTSISV